MDYCQFASILNQEIFIGSKAKLISSVAQTPQRFVGLFRPTKPKAKLVQNLLHSQEIKLGDAFEKIIDKYLCENGYCLMNKNVEINGCRKNIDLYFKKDKEVFVVEQKMRDDHDSSKKQGQMNDVRSKVGFVIQSWQNENIRGGIFFVDGSLTKNKEYYQSELQKMTVAHKRVSLNLWYAEEFFVDIFGKIDSWHEILSHLQQWRNDIPDFPNINFDVDAEKNFNEIKNISPSIWSKIFENGEIQKEILPVMFPTNNILNQLCKHYRQKSDGRYVKVSEQIQSYIDKKDK